MRTTCRGLPPLPCPSLLLEVSPRRGRARTLEIEEHLSWRRDMAGETILVPKRIIGDEEKADILRIAREDEPNQSGLLTGNREVIARLTRPRLLDVPGLIQSLPSPDLVLVVEVNKGLSLGTPLQTKGKDRTLGLAELRLPHEGGLLLRRRRLRNEDDRLLPGGAGRAGVDILTDVAIMARSNPQTNLVTVEKDITLKWFA